MDRSDRPDRPLSGKKFPTARRVLVTVAWTLFVLLLVAIQIGCYVSMSNPANWAPVISWSGE